MSKSFKTLLFFTLTTIMGCSSQPSSVSSHTAASRELASVDTPNRCLAIRGNGELMMAHISSLAAITEHFGFFDGLAGGSSASFSMFLYESVTQNPTLACGSGGARCDSPEIAAKAALLLKSIYSYVDIVKNSGEGRNALNLYKSLRKLQAELSEVDVKSIGPDSLGKMGSLVAQRIQLMKVQSQFKKLLSSHNVGSLFNQRAFDIMVDGKADAALDLEAVGNDTPEQIAIRAFRISELYDQIKNFGGFKATKRNIFFRPSLVSFDGLAQKFGEIANFYAGRGYDADDLKGVSDFEAKCSNAALGKSWTEFATSLGIGKTCAAQIIQVISAYHAKRQKAPVANPRVRDLVGTTKHILVGTGVLPGGAELFKQVSKKYLNTSTPTYDIKLADFNIFSQIKFGYIGRASDVTLLEENARNGAFRDDYKMKNMMALPGATWEEALNYSPAEPGLASLTLPSQLRSTPGSLWAETANASRPIVADRNGNVITAGWSDITPGLALRNIGCQEILYITRRGEEAHFLQELVQTMGASKELSDSLYESIPSAQPSSFKRSLAEMDGVWCTDWNASDLEVDHLLEQDHDAYAETNLETSRQDVVRNMLLQSSDPFAKRIVEPRFQGCGGSTLIPTPHTHVSVSGK